MARLNVKPILASSIQEPRRLKTLYGVASFNYRLLAYITAAALETRETGSPGLPENIKEIIFEPIKQVTNNGSNNDKKNIFQEEIEIKKMDWPREQSLHEACEKYSGGICGVINRLRTGLEEEWCGQGEKPPREVKLKGYELLKISAYCYPELLYPHRITLLGGSGETASVVKRMNDTVKSVYSRLDCRLKNSSLECGLAELSRLLHHPLRLYPTNYYAMVYLDADNASDLFSGLSAGLYYSISSSVMMVEETMQSGFMGSLYFTGVPVYVGGDDYIALLPLENAFDFIREAGSIIEKAGLKASTVLLLSHLRNPLRNTVSTLLSLMEKSKSTTINGSQVKNSLTIARSTGSGKIEDTTIPYIVFQGTLGGAGEYYAYTALVDRASRNISLRRELQKALQLAETQGYGWRVGFYKLLHGLEEISNGGLKPYVEAVKRVMWTASGLEYTVLEHGDPTGRHGFTELARSTTLFLEPELAGSSVFKEWWEAGRA